MQFGGLQKTTLIDFPGTVACTIFTVGCNFRCPFCHNKDLVTLAAFKKAKLPTVSEEELMVFLQERRKWLDGVCISGGEPTIQKDLPEFIAKIKDMGYKVKLDSNGSRPEVLELLFQAKLLDYTAMDIKAAFSEYKKAVNVQCSMSNVQKSIKLILQSGADYDFRTTVVPGMHTLAGLKKLAEDLKREAIKANYKPEKIKYFLQNFRPQNCLSPQFMKITPFKRKELKDMLKSVQNILPCARIRGEE